MAMNFRVVGGRVECDGQLVALIVDAHCMSGAEALEKFLDGGAVDRECLSQSQQEMEEAGFAKAIHLVNEALSNYFGADAAKELLGIIEKLEWKHYEWK